MLIEEKKGFNILLIGDYGVGKTTLINQIINNGFSESHCATLGIDITKQEIKVENSKYYLNFLDTSGQGKFQSINQSIYKRADCCVVVYDLTDQFGPKSVQRWVNNFLEYRQLDPKDNFPIIVVGTHLDNLERIDSLENYKTFQVSLKDQYSVEQISQAIINATALKFHQTIKEQVKINPISLKFTNSVNTEFEGLDQILSSIEESKTKMLEDYNKLIENVQDWKKKINDIKQVYNSPSFIEKFEQSHLSEELFIHQELINFNDNIAQINQSYIEQTEKKLNDIYHLTKDTSNIKIEINNRKPKF
ncbi:unnamed protein product [Paramecium octaurelia]|uniref:Uncharacterized protein n=1 Tax=Paramecium octaurelia TaxID=43137 RepID=A0A8S1XGR3_PAROT|nr:unnamed protein product [Paramecium octaurelia]